MKFSNIFVSECSEYSTYSCHVQAPVFRKSFLVGDGEKKGEISICGLGFYDLFVNGKKITKGYLAPYISNPDHFIYYDSYDISSYLQTGENVIGIMLGDGFQNSKTAVWDFAKNSFNSAPKLAITVSIEQGERNLTFDARDFVCKKGPIWFNDLRSGVFYDKRLEDTGWKMPGFSEDDTWHAPILVKKPSGKAKSCEAEPIVVTKEISPVSIRKGELAPYEIRQNLRAATLALGTQEAAPARTGGWLYDFGENNAGIFRLKIKGYKGQRIDIQCGEQLLDGALDYGNIHFYPDGYAQRDIYIVGSDEEEIFEPMFTYHGYRYLYVSGIEEEQAIPELLTYLVMSSDLEDRGSFECSDEVANAIYDISRRSDISNFYYFPTDCPHREKNGWTGDAQLSAEHMMLTIGAEKSYREWLRNICAAQNEEGKIPSIIPTGTWSYSRNDGPAWDKVLFELPYMVYKYRGETEMITENAHAMLRYLEYVSKKRDERGLVEYGLGDWMPVDKTAREYDAPLGFTASVTLYSICCEAEEMFEAVGLPLHSSFAKQMGMELKANVRREYIDFETMLVKSECQCAQAMGIYYDIFEEDEKQEAFQRLIEIIHRDNEKATCGMLGFRVLFHVLADFGEVELAYRMITSTEYPSYGYFVKNGDTTLPEHILPDEKRRKESLNHHAFGDVAQWYMKYPGGIRVINSSTVVIQPVFIKSLDYAKVSHKLPKGEVKVEWHREADKIVLNVNCPKEVAYEILLPEEENVVCSLQNDNLV